VYLIEPPVSLFPFRGFSPFIKYLYLKSAALRPSQIFDFILSSPILEDLTVTSYKVFADDSDGPDGPSTTTQPSNLPAFTGSLELPLDNGMKPIVGRLLTMPGGIHFRKLTLKCIDGEDLLLAMALVRECSDTLESLDLTCNAYGTSTRYLRHTDNLLLF